MASAQNSFLTIAATRFEIYNSSLTIAATRFEIYNSSLTVAATPFDICNSSLTVTDDKNTFFTMANHPLLAFLAAMEETTRRQNRIQSLIEMLASAMQETFGDSMMDEDTLKTLDEYAGVLQDRMLSLTEATENKIERWLAMHPNDAGRFGDRLAAAAGKMSTANDSLVDAAMHLSDVLDVLHSHTVA
ncbi:hypothetical protein FN846DRAFT_912607 [Sphaerosporella brunnea]|uniref:Uncharacterized protein n=1 Tax=Sphaerosporella brunnea TaxID=1250544 RepID=A0A5J5EI54_9PEZI|nr:hypothetical protein FN846DRAFT_912607 [Sphaerosporella brunnea]